LPDAIDCRTGERVTIGVRPEHIDIVDDAGGQTDGIIRAVIDIAEQLGGETYFYCSAEDFLPQLTIHQLGQRRLHKGQTLRLRLRPEHVHVFDAAGRALRNAIAGE
jgi:ABC-type sugar transport system ATPase subunit